MKQTLVLLIMLTIFTVGEAQSKKVKVIVDHQIECVDKPYQLVFHDEFEGDTLNTSKWYTFYPYGPQTALDSCAFCRTHVSANVYKDENCIVQGGKLLLKSDVDTTEWFGKTYHYSSALVYSKQIFNTYGKYEIRCKIAEGKQMWPAFWIFGWNTEIDVYEFICDGPTKPEFSIHKWMQNTCENKRRIKKGQPCFSNQTGKVDFGIDFSKDFHTFAVAYEPTLIKFYIDDIMVRFVPKYYDLKGRPITTCPIPPGKYLEDPSFPFYGEPVQVIAGESVCRSHKEKNPIFPNFMEIDYIRVYQKDIQSGLKPLFPMTNE
ncbi:MAG: glycoside hydrolase family 16 protein [Saprospiraceae bacterium]|nr:MAG: glucan endo-1,3-beta-D-glucosidase [Bacteroidetes bacterium OLB9]MCO6462833.1 glycoside hydrolase family 16 protein [Saprospiraceae bacterium]MCZ2339270.1 glycoside hydrolase family 16 protein [Chitinophagales bacterium]